MISIQDVPLPVPAIKIRNIEAEIRDLTLEIIPDKVIIQGVIHKQIFFVGNDNIVHHQTDDMPFDTFVDVPGAAPGMAAQIDIDIEKVFAELNPEGTIVTQKVLLNIFVKVEEEEVIRVALDKAGTLVEVDQLIAEGEKQIIKENEVILDQTAIKVDEIRGLISNIETDVISGKVVIQGVLQKQIFFINQENNSIHQAEEVPFETFIELPGVQPGMDVQVKPEIEFIGFDLAEDGITLSQKNVIKISVRVTQPVQTRIASGFDFLAKLPVVIGENTTQLMRRSEITLDQPAQKVKEINADIINVRTEVLQDKVIVQGIVLKQIFFVDNNNIERHQVEDLPFSTFIEIPGAAPGQTVRVEPKIEDIIFNLINDTLLEEKVIIEIFAKVEEINQLNVLLDEAGLETVLPVVIGENQKQLLVEQKVPPPPPPRQLIIEFITIVQRVEVAARKQAIIENIVELPCPAIKVKEPTAAEIIDVKAELILDDLVAVTGTVVKDIAFVCPDNIVRHIEERVPFRIEIPLPEPIGPGEIVPEVTIEAIINRLIDGGRRLKEIIILEARIEADSPRFIRVVTLIEGTDITTETVLVREEVVVSEDPLVTEVRTFPVVTNVNDPLGLLTRVIKETLVLNVVGVGRIPIEVVVFAE